MSEVALALFVGTVTGITFSIFKLPLPAPPVFSGVVGIVGVYIGSQIYIWIQQLF